MNPKGQWQPIPLYNRIRLPTDSSRKQASLGPNQALNSARLPRGCHRCGSAQMERGGRAVA